MLQGFVRVARVGELARNEMMLVSAKGTDVLLARVGDAYFAISNTCSHARGGMLDQGFLLAESCEVECPIHAARFSLRTGEATGGPTQAPVGRFSVKVEGDAIFVGPGD